MYDIASNVWGKTKTVEDFVILHLLERYVNGAIIQWERIQKVKKELPGPGPGVDGVLMSTLFLDIHFYFICYEKAQNLFKKLTETDGDQKLYDLWNYYKSKFKPYNDARNHLEHMETRMDEKYLSDFGNLSKDTYTFGGERFDISHSGLEMLTKAYKKIIDILNSRKVNHGSL